MYCLVIYKYEKCKEYKNGQRIDEQRPRCLPVDCLEITQKAQGCTQSCRFTNDRLEHYRRTK